MQTPYASARVSDATSSTSWKKASRYISKALITVYSTVVRAMCQVNGGGSFSAPLGLRNPWTDSLEIWHVWLRTQSDPTCKTRWPPQMGGGVKLYPRVLFSYFGSFSASTAYPEKRGFSLNASKMCFGGGCVPLGSVWPWGQIFPHFTPKNIFQWLKIETSYLVHSSNITCTSQHTTNWPLKWAWLGSRDLYLKFWFPLITFDNIK